METITINVAFQEGDEVYFRQDQEKMWIVVGYEVSGNTVNYLVSTPEHGTLVAVLTELITERSVF